MKRLAVLSMLPLGLCAQGATQPGRFEASVHVAQQSYDSAHLVIPFGTWTVDFSNAKNTVAMVSFGYDMVQTPTFSLQVNAAYQPERTTELTYVNSFGGSVSNNKAEYSESAKALGLMARYHGGVVLGGGLEFRSEQVSYGQVTSGGSTLIPASGTLNRMWLRASLGVPFGTGSLRPTLGLEIAKPLTSGPSVDGNSTKEDNVKHLAATGQVGLFFALHF